MITGLLRLIIQRQFWNISSSWVYRYHFYPPIVKNKKQWFSWSQKRTNAHKKSLFFIFLNKRIQIVPKYSGTVDISKTSGFLIGGNLWSWEQQIGFLVSRATRSDMSCGNRSKFVERKFCRIICGTILYYWVIYPKCPTDLKSDRNRGPSGHCTVFFCPPAVLNVSNSIIRLLTLNANIFETMNRFW